MSFLEGKLVNLENIIGLGYVGLPLAVEFGKKVPVIGFDIHKKRIEELQGGQDHTLEVSPEELQQATQLSYSANLDDLKSCNFFIVTVPTPIDDYKQPDLTPLIKASTNDPWVDIEEAKHEYGLTPITQLQNNHYDAVILAVAHDEFKNMSLVDFKELLKENYVLYDLKYILDVQDSDLRL